MNSKAIRISQSDSLNLAANLSSLLKSKKLSSNALAQALGLPAVTIIRLTSGETADPQISTLTLIADYFGITVDALIKGEITDSKSRDTDLGMVKPNFVPVLDWELAAKIDSIKELNLTTWEKWEPILLEENALSEKTFALESRPSMYPDFSHGTIFIIDPQSSADDGDLVLVKILNNNEVTLRTLAVDPPQWLLCPVISGSSAFQYSTQEHKIIGVVILTLFHNKKRKV